MVILLLLLTLWQDAVLPYKASDEFEVLVDFQFKTRPTDAHGNYSVKFTDSENRSERPGEQLPYLMLNVKLHKLSDAEGKVKVVNNLGKRILSKKVAPETIVKLDLGFVQDIKSHTVAHEYTLYFSGDKTETSRILLTIKEDGAFFVNEVQQGKF